MEELKRRRGDAERAVREAGALLEQHSGKKGGAVVGNRGAQGQRVFTLSEKDRKAAEEYRKQTEEMDAEEDYYNTYYKRKGDEDDGSNASANDAGLNGDDDDSDAEDMPEDATRYDIQLRDLVRPLRAWGYDLSGKPGFAVQGNSGEDPSDGDGERGADDAERSDDEEEEEDQEDDEAVDSDEEDPATTDDEARGPAKKKRKQAASAKTKKSGAAVSASGVQGGAQKGGGTKKKTVKRKRAETPDSGGAAGTAPNKNIVGKPVAKKPVGTAAAASAMAKKAKVGEKGNESVAAAKVAGSTGVAGNSK